MTLAQDMPWADEVTGADPFATYYSNLAGPEHFVDYLGARPPQHTLSGYAEELSALEPVAESAREIGAVSNAFLGAFAIPTLLQKMTGGSGLAPLRPGSILIGAVVGGMLGYWQPLTITLIQGLVLLEEIHS